MKTTQTVSIRKSTPQDLPRLLEIFALARRFMARTGNPHQWEDGYPGQEQLAEDIESGDSYVIAMNGRVVATFFLRGGEDPTYETIYDGEWLDNGPYGTLHRVASNSEIRGVLHLALEFALRRFRSVRVDTHRDNAVMQNAVRKEGFRYCGVIHCRDGSERLAYQYLKR